MTRLGKHINELRRKAQDRSLATRAKNLVKKWRKLLVNSEAAPAAPAVLAAPADCPSQQAQGEKFNGHGKPLAAAPIHLPPHVLRETENHQHHPHSSSPRLSPALTTATATVRSPAAATATTVPPSSSVPSSASTSPGLSASRPATPAHGNNGAGSRPSSRPVSPYSNALSGGGESAVPKTNAANKRLRKFDSTADVVEPPSKRPHLSNGCGRVSPPSDGENTRDSFVSVGSACDTTNVPPPSTAGVPPASTSRPPSTTTSPQRVSTPSLSPAMVISRRKTRRSMERGPDVLEQQLLSVRKGAGKARTTQEIMEALRSHSPGLPPTSKIGNGVNDGGDGLVDRETKAELMSRFFESQQEGSVTAVTSGNTSSMVSPAASSSAEPTGPDEGSLHQAAAPEKPELPASVESVMAALPIISASEVMAEWDLGSDHEEQEEEEEDVEMDGLIPVKKPEVEVTDEMVSKLHEKPMENFNGNFDHAGEFKEWHEMLTKETAGGELLHVLPYSVIE